MTDEDVFFESRRARREAQRAAETSTETSEYRSPTTAELPSRRELRRIAQETGVIPVITPEMLRESSWTPDVSPLAALAATYDQIQLARVAQSGTAVEAETIAAIPDAVVEAVAPPAPPVIQPPQQGGWRDQLADDSEHGWVENHSAEIGVVQSPALQTLVVDSYHTGDISGPLNSTGEIFITGQILIEPLVDETPGTIIDAGIDLNHAGIPRRASEALSIIGKPAASEKHKRIPSVGSAVVAGLAAGLGALAIAIAALAYFTDFL
jgi:hypothetical protein